MEDCKSGGGKIFGSVGMLDKAVWKCFKVKKGFRRVYDTFGKDERKMGNCLRIFRMVDVLRYYV